jgi:hypothetical protein
MEERINKMRRKKFTFFHCNMKHNFAGDEFNHVNNCVVKGMQVVGTKLIPENRASHSNMIVTLTVGKCSRQ